MVVLRSFTRSERGSVSLWNLFWFTGFIVILGLAADITGAINTRSYMQNVADASAHAGVMDITPTPTKSVDTAVAYATENIPQQKDVVNDADVTIGWWDHDSRTFRAGSNGDGEYNAVKVVSTRDKSRANAMSTAFLSIIGFRSWDVNAIAIATYSEFPECLANGLFAGGTLDQTSNNTILAPFCLYGHQAFKIGQNNLIQCGVSMMTPSITNYQNGTPPVPSVGPCNDNYGALSSADMIDQSFTYRSMPVTARAEYMKVKELLTAYVAGEPLNDIFKVIPTWIRNVEQTSPGDFNKLAKKGDLVPGTLYHVACGGGGPRLELSGIVRNIGLFTDCEVVARKDTEVSAEKPQKTESGTHALCDPDDSDCSNTDWIAEITEDRWSCADAVAAGFESYTTALDGTYRDGTVDRVAEDCAIEPGANGLWDNVFVFTSYREGGNTNQSAVSFPNNMQLGRIDGCTEGGGVHIYSAGSIDTPSGTVAHGLQVVTLGSVKFAAKADGSWGINILAMDDIKYTANGLMGGCNFDPDARESEVIITARPIAIVR